MRRPRIPGRGRPHLRPLPQARRAGRRLCRTWPGPIPVSPRPTSWPRARAAATSSCSRSGPRPARPPRPCRPSSSRPNMEGTVPLSGEAALYLAKLVCDKADLRADRTWYILACGNPDAAAGYLRQAPAPRRRATPGPGTTTRTTRPTRTAPTTSTATASSPRCGSRTPRASGSPSPASPAS
ncbi:MAG: hypothetical protein M0C28_32460 [Candidatus Moduliflexus flocculans]|nr:hypothetical protein [Candidatus Moduliflexus flocculans]